MNVIACRVNVKVTKIARFNEGYSHSIMPFSIQYAFIIANFELSIFIGGLYQGLHQGLYHGCGGKLRMSGLNKNMLQSDHFTIQH